MESIFETRLKEIKLSDDRWFSAVISMYFTESAWINRVHGNFFEYIVKNHPLLVSYTINANRIFIQIDQNLRSGNGMISALLLRGFLERLSLIYFGITHSDSEFASISDDLMSSKVGDRESVTVSLLKEFDRKFLNVNELYDILSRYFAHISVTENFSGLLRASIHFADDYYIPYKNFNMGYLIFVMIVYDVILYYSKLIESTMDGLPSRRYRTREFSIDTETVMYVCKMIFGGKVTKSNPLRISSLYSGVKGVTGKIGITNVYKNKMAIMWYGEGQPPNITAIKEFVIFANGNKIDIEKSVKIYLREQDNKSARYEVVWEKEIPYDKLLILFAARNIQGSELDFFDYILPFWKNLIGKK